jgi:hypothetical protein
MDESGTIDLRNAVDAAVETLHNKYTTGISNVSLNGCSGVSRRTKPPSG